ncbi:helix-turn-helix domain-containing protein [Schaalia sp. lx-260]|uniref:helix-turn-helix domain-containing protein n=1 Tax=Schaalia sp. lx-260 TaxID=2899082 RepID=UPI001E545F78|nr:helix-turn-helix transcriptional regulator [Schaalia sp. lx-260]MCD4549710.1 helix-turn-helix transcriptional regulator [Schaalia sp. lx-260]
MRCTKMDIYELLGETPNSAENHFARTLVAADEKLIQDLVAMRTALGYTQQEVAKIMGTTQASISRFESGQSDIHLSTIRRYAQAIGAIVHHNVRQFNNDASEIVTSTRELYNPILRESDSSHKK